MVRFLAFLEVLAMFGVVDLDEARAKVESERGKTSETLSQDCNLSNLKRATRI